MSEHELRVDWITCEGYGLCGDYAPDLVALDEWRYPIVGPGPITGARLHDAQRIVDCCPVRALRLQRKDPGQRRGRQSPLNRLLANRSRDQHPSSPVA